MIQINDRRKVYTIQSEFNKLFPNLKIEFYSKPHKSSGAPGRKMIKSASKTIGECRNVHNDGEMTINPNMTISELESYFINSYGLGIKVSAKFGKNWIEPKNVNKLSLAQQNNQS